MQNLTKKKRKKKVPLMLFYAVVSETIGYGAPSKKREHEEGKPRIQ